MDVQATIKELKELFAKREAYAYGEGETFWQRDEDRIFELSEALLFYVESRGLAA